MVRDFSKLTSSDFNGPFKLTLSRESWILTKHNSTLTICLWIWFEKSHMLDVVSTVFQQTTFCCLHRLYDFDFEANTVTVPIGTHLT